jgi:multiple sugar transport system permease protein
MSSRNVPPIYRRFDDLLFVNVKWLLVLFVVGISLLPFIYALSVSFRPASELYSQQIYLIPHQPTLDHWTTAFNDLSQALVNSFLVATGTTILSLLITIPGAYVFGRQEFPGKHLGFYLIVVAIMFPYILLIVPIADLWSQLGLFNTIPGLWIAYQIFVTPFAIWILRDFFEKLPQNLEESAQIYGCTKWSAFVRVVLPMSTPAIVAVGFLAFLVGWNDFLMSNMLTTGTGPRPAVVQLYLATTGGETPYWGLTMAETLIIGVPPTVLYLLSRRYLAESFEMT